MPLRGRILPLAILFLAFVLSPSPAAADPVTGCSSSSYSLASYGPCLASPTILLDNITATVGGADVSTSSQLAMTLNVDAYPPEARWVLFNVPVAGEFEHTLSRATPLEVGFRMSALGGSEITLLDMVLTNTAFSGYTGTAEFRFTYGNGLLSTYGVGGGVPDRVIVATPGSVSFMDVRVRVFENAQRGGSSIGLFAGTEGSPDPAPVSEPGTMALLGSGLAMAFARYRKRR